MRPHRLSLVALLSVAGGCFSPASDMDTEAATADTGAMTATDGSASMGSTSRPVTDTLGETSGSPSTGAASETDTMADTGMADTGMADTGMAETEDDEDIEFFDTFDRDTGAWTFVDDGAAQKEGPSEWVYRSGDLVQLSDISGLETLVPSAGTYAMGGDSDWDAYLVEIAYTADDDGVAGVVCHASPEGNFIRLELDHETGIVRLVERAGGENTILAETEAFEVPMELEIERIMTLDCGATYRGFIDGMLWVEAEGNANAEGGVGMYASSIGDGPSGLRFHSIEVGDD